MLENDFIDKINACVGRVMQSRLAVHSRMSVILIYHASYKLNRLCESKQDSGRQWHDSSSHVERGLLPMYVSWRGF